MTTWSEQIERRARLLHAEIASWQVRAADLGIDPATACAPFYEMLDAIYAEDFPLAKAKDNSDLLLHLEGTAVQGSPRVSLVSGLFNNVKAQVRDLTKAIAGIVPDQRVPIEDVDLGLSGLAKGSLFIGFNVPLPRERNGHKNLLGKQDPLYRATKDALRIINTVSHTIEIEDEEQATRHVAQVVDDPKVRDAALVALRRIAPSGKKGVTSIGVTSSQESRRPAELTPEVRSQIGRMLLKPVSGREVLQLEGTIRGIDLDAKRFDLRWIVDHKLQDIRCVYSHFDGIEPRKLLDARVVVRGLVERRSDEAPRLMAVEAIEVVKAPEDNREH